LMRFVRAVCSRIRVLPATYNAKGSTRILEHTARTKRIKAA